MPAVPPIRRGGSRRPQMRLEEISDFTGGLNLRGDDFDLKPNETPDCLNVDFDHRGGLSQRLAVDTFGGNTFVGTNITSWRSIFAFPPSGQVLVNAGSGLWYGTGGGWTSVGVDGSSEPITGPMHAVTYDGKLWVQRNAEQDPKTWDGSSLAALTDPAADSWQDDYASPSGSHMPLAKFITIRQDFAYIANTKEGSSTFGSRIRWSHPGDPGSWREADFIDIDTGRDGDQITALAQWRDYLIIFKDRSIHLLSGFDADTFRVVEVARDIGCVSQEALVQTPQGIFFFDRRHGVFRYDGANIDYLFDAIYPAMRDNRIPSQYVDKTMLGWVNQRLWVTVAWGAATARDRTFVYDPLVGKDGAWTAYDLATGPYLPFNSSTGKIEVAGCEGCSYLLKLDQDADADDFGAGDTHIESYWVSPWLRGGNVVGRKRWKRPEFVIDTNVTRSLLVEIFKDYDYAAVARTFNLVTQADGTYLVWDVGNWGEDLWGTEDSDRDGIVRGTSLGNARAIALRVRGPSTDHSWRLNAISLKYIPKPLRS